MRRLALPLLLLNTSGCTYLNHLASQSEYRQQFDLSPSQWLAKHELEQPTYFVFGRLLAPASTTQPPLAVVAISDRFVTNEVVEVNHVGRADSYFGLNLPPGGYRLLALADLNGDGHYSDEEVVGERAAQLAEPIAHAAARMVGPLDITLGTAHRSRTPLAPIAVMAPPVESHSLFYPNGTIRRLDDPIFAPAMGQLGIYEPAAFLERAPMMFYALEEEIGYKIPVIFVHGMGGSTTDFSALIDHLDRRYYKPWFFYYPSGTDLRQLAHFFYEVFLSGQVIPADRRMPLVVISHSMGSLVVREALNSYSDGADEAHLALWISLSAPFGGHPSAALGVDQAPLVVPAWRDLDPRSTFIAELFRRPLPPALDHRLLYTYEGAPHTAPEGDDGVVPVASELRTAAVTEASRVVAVQAGHSEVLRDPGAIATVLAAVGEVEGPYPAPYLRYLLAGGFELPPGDRYQPRERHALRYYGRFLRAIAQGDLPPRIPGQEHFVLVAQGKAEPSNEVESAWAKFQVDYPQLAAERETLADPEEVPTGTADLPNPPADPRS